MKKVRNLSEGSMYREKSGRWRYAITIGYDGRGRQIRKTVSGKTKSECIKRRNALLSKLESGEFETQKDPFLSTWADDWLQNIESSRAPNTAMAYRSSIRAYVIPVLGAYQLSEIGYDEVRELVDHLRAKGLKPGTIKHHVGVFSTMMKAAVRADKIKRNPCEMIELPPDNEKRRESFTVEEAKKIIQTAYAENDPYASLWLTAFLTGMRKGELCAIHSDNIDRENSILNLSWQVIESQWLHGAGCKCRKDTRPSGCPDRVLLIPENGEYLPLRGRFLLSRPKTSSGRRQVPIPRVLLDALPKKEGFLWTLRNGDCLNPMILQSKWKKAVRRAGVPYRSIHSTRHTTASLLLELGVPMEMIINIIGHSTALSTRRYLHTSAEAGAAALGKIGDLLGVQDTLNKPSNGV